MNARDKKADFERFYKENLDKIYRFVFFRVGADKELAEDLVSEIFIKALNAFDSYDEKISRSAWVFTIAKNHLANYWRDHKKESSLPGGEEEETGESDAFWHKIAFKNYQQMVLKQQVYEFLEVLEGEEKDLVTLHYLFGYSYAEIAEMRESTEAAVKVAAHRALKKIREKNDI